MRYIRLSAALQIFFVGVYFDQMSDMQAKILFSIVIITLMLMKNDRYDSPLDDKDYILSKPVIYRGLLFSFFTIKFNIFCIIIFKWTSKKWFPLMISITLVGVHVGTLIQKYSMGFFRNSSDPYSLL